MIRTWKRAATYIHIVTSGDAGKGSLTLDIASGSAPTDDFYFIGQVRRSGVDIPGFDFDYVSGTGFLTVSNADSVSLTENDVVTVMGAWVK